MKKPLKIKIIDKKSIILLVIVFLTATAIAIIYNFTKMSTDEFEFEYNDDHSGVYITKYIGKSSNVIIPDTFKGKRVIGIGTRPELGVSDGINVVINAGAFYCCKDIISVTIPNSVTSIGENAFFGCESLTSVTIPNSVTEIGSSFIFCTSLTSVTIPDSVTEIDRYAFYGCYSLTSVTYKGKTYDYEHIYDLYDAINSD